MLAVDQAVLSPGNCVFCQSSQGPFVDTLRDDDDPRVEVGENQVGFGVINRWYICAPCVSNMMQLVGSRLRTTFLPTEKLEAERAEAAATAAALTDALVRIEDLESSLRVMHSLNPMAGEPEPEPPVVPERSVHPSTRPRRR